MAVVGEDIWLPSEILPIVKIHALGLVMLLVERAALGLEIEHEKVSVLLHLMDEPGLQLLGAVREGAVVTVLTLAKVLGILGAVLGLVLLGMVDALNSVVGELALLLGWATLSLIVIAQVGSVEIL